MAIKPILFNTEMVQAILDGRKTVTRRVVKPQPEMNLAYIMAGYQHGKWSYSPYVRPTYDEHKDHPKYWTPPCHTDDILYVRETWCDPSGTGWPIIFKADLPMHWDAEETENGEPADLRVEDCKWLPSIHMPKWAARIFLRVTDVRVERLQDITGDECPSEGVPLYSGPVGGREACYRFCFADIWDDTIKPSDLDDYGWSANPWVWVIKFERCEKPKEALW